MYMDKYRLKKILRGSSKFYLVDIETLESVNDWAEYLDSILHGDCYVLERNGELILVEQRQLIEVVHGLRIEIYLKEHTPPHFHVTSTNVDASFRIDNCNKMIGSISRKEELAIKFWWQKAKPRLIDVWDKTRPSDCIVGKYKNPT